MPDVEKESLQGLKPDLVDAFSQDLKLLPPEADL
jgi:hypothetical protein